MDSQNSLQLAKMKNASQEVRDFSFKMEAVKKNIMPPADKAKKLRESCEGFESIFIQKMWEQMRATVPESGLLKGREEKFWQSMYDQELAKSMAAAGGIGLADMMYEQLSRNLSNASKNTANALGGQPSGFGAELTPAPLMQAKAQQASTTANTVAVAQRQKLPAVSGLYTELASSETSAQGAPGTTHEATEDETNPAIMAVLNELRAVHQANSSSNMNHADLKGPSLGARHPLPAMQSEGHNLEPDPHPNSGYVSSLSMPVHKPVTGRGTVLPRSMSGPRVGADQPINRGLPFPKQTMPQPQVSTQLPNVPLTHNDQAVVNTASVGNGQENLHVLTTQQRSAQMSPATDAPAPNFMDKAKVGG